MKIKCLFALLASCALLANAQNDPFAPLPLDSAVHTGVLDNGLSYYIRYNNTQKGRADFYIVQKVGSILEQPSQRGLAHFLEHMAFNGTQHFPGKSLINCLERNGVQFGGNLNAYTSVDETVYMMIDVPVNRENLTDTCLMILRDWADGISLEDKEIDSERGVIEEEWRSRDNYMMRMYDQLLPVIYKGSKYEDCMPIGSIDVIRNFKYQTLRDYYTTWYRPDLQGIVVVGDIDVKAVESRIRAVFSDYNKKQDAPKRIYYEVPDNAQPQIVFTQDKESPYTLVLFMQKHEPFPVDKRNSLPWIIQSYCNSLYAQMFQNRLNELLEKPNMPFSSAEISNSDFLLAQTKEAWQYEAISTPENWRKALTLLLTEKERVQRYGFTTAEYERAKASYLSGIEHAWRERDKRKNRTISDELIRLFLDNEPVPGLDLEYQLSEALAAQINVEHINASIKADSTNQVIWIGGPLGNWATSESDLLGLMDSIGKADIQPYTETVSNEPLLAALPSKGQIKKEQKMAFDIICYQLSNGINVYYKQTDFKEDEVLLKAVSKGGMALEQKVAPATLKVLDDMIHVGGLGQYSAVNLRKKLAGKHASAKLSVENYTETLTGNSSIKDAKTLFELCYLLFTDRRSDKEAAQAYLEKLESSLRSREGYPMLAWQDSIISVLYNNQPLFTRIRPADVADIDYNSAMATASRRFANAADFDFVVVGNLPADSLKPLLEQYIASLPANGKKEKVKDPGWMPLKGERNVHYTQQMENPKTIAMVFAWNKQRSTQKDRLTLNLLDQILQIVYTETVREEQGGTYGVRVNTSWEEFPSAYWQTTLSFETDSAKLPSLLPLLYSGIQDIADHGPRDKDLQKVKEYTSKVAHDRLRENAFWLSYISNYCLFGRNELAKYDQTLESINAEDIRQMAKKLLQSKNWKEIVQTGTH